MTHSSPWIHRRGIVRRIPRFCPSIGRPQTGFSWLRLHWNHSRVKILSSSFDDHTTITLLWMNKFSFFLPNDVYLNSSNSILQPVDLYIQHVLSKKIFSAQHTPHLLYKHSVKLLWSDYEYSIRILRFIYLLVKQIDVWRMLSITPSLHWRYTLSLPIGL